MGVFYDDSYGGGLTGLGWVAVFVLILGVMAGFIFAFMCVRWSTGEKVYTGYIYSADDHLGDSTSGHLRFSEYAGEDEQPSFCVKKSDGQQLKDLAGSGKKVRVTVPTGFAIAFPWECPIPASVEVVEE